MTLTIEPNNEAKWWVDSSYVVHSDIKSHTGIYMTLGKGATYTASCKQKLKTKSSMEAELVAVDDAMSQVLWTRHFLATQGHPVGLSLIHASGVPLVLNLTSGAITAQFHVVFDNLFTMNNHQITGNNYVLTTLPLP